MIYRLVAWLVRRRITARQRRSNRLGTRSPYEYIREGFECCIICGLTRLEEEIRANPS